MYKPEREKKRTSPKSTPCETCQYYDVIDEAGTLGCTVDIDEDDAWRERADAGHICHFYKYYDEYKLVQKQN